LAFEDLQWADPTTLDLLRGTAERGAPAPLFVFHQSHEPRPPLALPGQEATSVRTACSGYGWFTEGFDTRDLKEAQALLEELAAPASRRRR
jgi:hypothetical protein